MGERECWGANSRNPNRHPRFADDGEPVDANHDYRPPRRSRSGTPQSPSDAFPFQWDPQLNSGRSLRAACSHRGGRAQVPEVEPDDLSAA